MDGDSRKLGQESGGARPVSRERHQGLLYMDRWPLGGTEQQTRLWVVPAGRRGGGSNFLQLPFHCWWQEMNPEQLAKTGRTLVWESTASVSTLAGDSEPLITWMGFNLPL